MFAPTTYPYRASPIGSLRIDGCNRKPSFARTNSPEPLEELECTRIDRARLPFAAMVDGRDDPAAFCSGIRDARRKAARDRHGRSSIPNKEPSRELKDT